MRGQLATGVGLGIAAAVGAALIARGAFTDDETSYRLGVGALLVSLACLVIHRSHCNTNRLIEHQTRLAVLTQQERQEWAERGYRAGVMDVPPGQQPSDARIVPLRPTSAPRRRRDGA